MPRLSAWLPVLVFPAATALGCGDGPGGAADASGVGELVGRGSASLLLGTVGSANGTYGAGCKGRSGAWSVPVSGTTALGHAALSVVKADTGCTLTLTEIVASATYAITPTIALDASYKGSASTVGSGAGKFYVNARLSDALFGDDFTVTMLDDDDPRTANGSVTAALAAASGPTVSGSATAWINDDILTIGKPAGTTSGMLLIAALANETNHTASLTGWTSLGHSTNSLTLDILYRFAAANEPASYTFALTGHGRVAGGIVAISGANASPFDLVGSAAASWTAPSITTTTNNTLVMGCWANIASLSTPPGTMTELWDLYADDKVAVACGYEARATAGATGTRVASGSGAHPSSRLFAVKP